MQVDILIFALIALALILKLKSVLGTRSGNETPQNNPFAYQAEGKAVKPAHINNGTAEDAGYTVVVNPDLIAAEFNKEGAIAAGLEEIAEADRDFDINEFMDGAQYAFELIVTSFAQGARDDLKPLLSPKLYEDFNNTIKARELVGHSAQTEIHRITEAKIIEAHLGGTMAYITVSYTVEQTSVTRDKAGAVIEGNPDKISTVKDIWTFMRDTRAEDLNWLLIETRAAEK